MMIMDLRLLFVTLHHHKIKMTLADSVSVFAEGTFEEQVGPV